MLIVLSITTDRPFMWALRTHYSFQPDCRLLDMLVNCTAHAFNMIHAFVWVCAYLTGRSK